MTQKFLVVIAVVILAICLISGGCQPAAEQKAIKTWKDLVNLLPEAQSANQVNRDDTESVAPPAALEQSQATLEVLLYFAGEDGRTLVPESRTIPKEEGIARSTLTELIKGPKTPEYLRVFPEGTRLLDINVKPDGLCIVDLSNEACQVSNRQQEELMVMAVANTVGQFPTVQEVSFMIDGHPVSKIGGFLDLSDPIKPD